jgi:hypothetical protein
VVRSRIVEPGEQSRIIAAPAAASLAGWLAGCWLAGWLAGWLERGADLNPAPPVVRKDRERRA